MWEKGGWGWCVQRLRAKRIILFKKKKKWLSQRITSLRLLSPSHPRLTFAGAHLLPSLLSGVIVGSGEGGLAPHIPFLCLRQGGPAAAVWAPACLFLPSVHLVSALLSQARKAKLSESFVYTVLGPSGLNVLFLSSCFLLDHFRSTGGWRFEAAPDGSEMASLSKNHVYQAVVLRLGCCFWVSACLFSYFSDSLIPFPFPPFPFPLLSFPSLLISLLSFS